MIKRILVCFTGGTFSSDNKNNVMNVSTFVNEEFVELVKSRYKDVVEFRFISTVFMLSENMYPEVWEKITSDINLVLEKDSELDGIILIHGSDTAAYTTSFLSYYYRRLPIPFVVTASNAPITEQGSNGLNNFFSSIDFILTSGLKGTFFSFQRNKDKGERTIHKADELLEANSYTDEFSSTFPSAFGKIENRRFIGRDQEKPKNIEKGEWKFEPFEYKYKVLGIMPFTGLDYSVFDLDSKNYKAVVHGSYHSCTQNSNMDIGYGDYSIVEFIKKCENKGIDFYLSNFPQNRLELPIYESTERLVRLGAIPIYLPFESAYTKAIFIYNHTMENKRDFMMK